MRVFVMLRDQKQQQQTPPLLVQIQDIVVVSLTRLYYMQKWGESDQYQQADKRVAGQHDISTNSNIEIGDKYTSSKEKRANNTDTRFYISSDEIESGSVNSRIMKTIEEFVTQAKHHHQSVSDPNTITRLVTNEFMFFTKKPFELAEFEDLQISIFQLAEKAPENIHLILSSFAVLTPYSIHDQTQKIMNVVIHIECGTVPVINYCVKNASSPIDPVYYTSPAEKAQFPYVNKDRDSLEFQGVMIEGKVYPFSYNNIFECKTKGGISFFTCLDICIDHVAGKAKSAFDEKLKEMDAEFTQPLSCSHVLTSNIIKPKRENIIGEVLTHADPQDEALPKAFYKAGEAAPQPISLTSLPQQHIPPFGTPLTILVTPPVTCSLIYPPQFTVTASRSFTLETLHQMLETPLPFNSSSNNSSPNSSLPNQESIPPLERAPLLVISQQQVATISTAPHAGEEAQGAENKTPEERTGRTPGKK